MKQPVFKSASKDFLLFTDNKLMTETIQTTPPEENANFQDLIDRRRHERSTFTYPVEFIIFTKNPVSLKGYLKDISLGGSCLEFDDPYKRIVLSEALNAKLKLILTVPGIDKMSVLANIQWIRNIQNTPTVKLGIELKDVTMYQIDLISKLVGLKNRDRNMLWNLWEEYHN
jgi:hypothetical protein